MRPRFELALMLAAALVSTRRTGKQKEVKLPREYHGEPKLEYSQHNPTLKPYGKEYRRSMRRK